MSILKQQFLTNGYTFIYESVFTCVVLTYAAGVFAYLLQQEERVYPNH
jgi:hypothetical protein